MAATLNAETSKTCGDCLYCDFTSSEAAQKSSSVTRLSLIRSLNRLLDPTPIPSDQGPGDEFDDVLGILANGMLQRGIKKCAGQEGVIATRKEQCNNLSQFKPR